MWLVDLITELEAVKKLHRFLHFDPQLKEHHGKGAVAEVDAFLDKKIKELSQLDVVSLEKKEGWGWPGNSRKAHYFDGSRSLCGKWLYFGKDLEQGNDGSADNCTACKRAVAKRKAKQKVDELKQKGKLQF